MKIYHNDASLVVSKIINCQKHDFKKLSQTDRKICLKAIESLSLENNRGIEIGNYDDNALKEKIQSIEKELDTPLKIKKQSFILHLIFSIKKGIENFFHLRISSGLLYKKLNTISDNFFNHYWDLYLNDHCELIKSNGSIENAKIIFLGSKHTDPSQKIFLTSIISHYSDPIDENLILFEGEEYGESEFKNKKFSIEPWERSIQNEVLQMRNFNDEMMKHAEKLSKIETEKKEEILDIINKSKDFTRRAKELLQKSKEIGPKRDQSLLDTVNKYRHSKYKKIFVIARKVHLLSNVHTTDLLANFPEGAMIIPKSTFLEN